MRHCCISLNGNILGSPLTIKGQTPEEAVGHSFGDADEGENEGDDDDARGVGNKGGV